MSPNPNIGSYTTTGSAKLGTVTHAGSLIECAGGLEAVVAKFKEAGLSHVVQSWISNEENMSVTKEQLEKIFGGDVLNRLAAKTGVDASTLSAQLAQILPQVVDRLTPEGKIPTASGLVSILGSIFKRGQDAGPH